MKSKNILVLLCFFVLPCCAYKKIPTIEKSVKEEETALEVIESDSESEVVEEILQKDDEESRKVEEDLLTGCVVQ